MPWCEYLIKCFAWNRIETEKWKRARLIAYNARIGSHLDHKTLPKTEHAFLPLGDKPNRKRASEEAKEQLKKERDEFYRTDNG